MPALGLPGDPQLVAQCADVRLALELRGRGEDAEDKFAGGRRRVDRRALAGEHAQGDSACGEIMHGVDQVRGAFRSDVIYCIFQPDTRRPAGVCRGMSGSAAASVGAPRNYVVSRISKALILFSGVTATKAISAAWSSRSPGCANRHTKSTIETSARKK